MKAKALLLVLGCLGGCAALNTGAPADPAEEALRQDAAQRDAEYDALCARPDLDQNLSNWCTRRQQIKADQAAQAARDREFQAAEESRARRDRTEAIDRAFAPWRTPAPAPVYVPPPPIITQPRMCTSYVNGAMISTTCN